MRLVNLSSELDVAKGALDAVFYTLNVQSDGSDGFECRRRDSHYIQSLPRYLEQLLSIERILSSVKFKLRLPPEILASIFVELHNSAAVSQDGDPTRDISRLLTVSKLWRDVALGESRLWTVVHVEWPVERQDLWLQRSWNRPLTIVADCPNETEASVPSKLAISHRVAQQSGRWRAIHVKDFNQADVDAFLTPFVFQSKDLSSLEELVLDAGDWFSWHRGDYNAPPFTLLSQNEMTLPPFRLRSLRIFAIRLPNPEQLVRSLTHLQFTGTPYPLNVLARVLKECSSLESLELIGYFVHREEILAYVAASARTAMGDKIYLPRLKRMSVRLSGWNNALLAFLFVNIVSPELEEFSLDVKRQFIESPRNTRGVPSFEQFCMNSPKLRNLALLYDTTVISDILFSLPTEAFPHLHTLRIDCLDPQSANEAHSMATHFGMDYTSHHRRRGSGFGLGYGYYPICDDLERFVGARADWRGGAMLRDNGRIVPRRLAKLVLGECPDERRAWLSERVDELVLQRTLDAKRRSRSVMGRR
ncbi:uncharacterized protein EI90DRAFT_3129517 [Cantharellus anzutake]|uniref:uncharacterized protein n=1 Tax=Cantharellus anzutake TaxID=1750568 RepID=UPI0019062114|nr:uncharacterized protein EI90DRAFT_3129517 [Cantharellus anzutake]KAF8324767.1 hypothetical protein EI90DRAFT_3129517 [Cantharellus anzutake]